MVMDKLSDPSGSEVDTLSICIGRQGDLAPALIEFLLLAPVLLIAAKAARIPSRQQKSGVLGGSIHNEGSRRPVYMP